ncbi:MAG TPA: hypothetical protein VGG03_27315 [Thermoanaerobaculia bacterium]
MKRALGPKGVPGDTELLVFVARSIGGLYQEALEWGLRIRRVVSEEDLSPVVRTMEEFVNDILEKNVAFGPLVLREISRLEEASRRREPVSTGSVILSLQITGIDKFTKAADHLTKKLKVRKAS